MTVSELIAELSKYEADTPVMVETDFVPFLASEVKGDGYLFLGEPVVIIS